MPWTALRTDKPVMKSRRALKARSPRETENKLRLDVNKVAGGWKYSYGAVGQYVQFDNAVFSRIRREVRDENGNLLQPGVLIDFNTSLDFSVWCFRSGVATCWVTG